MPRVPLLVTVLVTLTASPALSENPLIDAVNGFGLVGTWSTNCAIEPARGNVEQHIFSISSQNTVQLTKVVSVYAGYRIITSILDVQAATRVDTDKIKMTMTMRSIASSQPQDVPSAINPKPVDQVIQKLGPTIRLLDSRDADGQRVFVENGLTCGLTSTGGGQAPCNMPKPTAVLLRCSN